ncbi:MAG: Bax inhibitor-1/YccA family protein [Defluviitaleaceae bacterium]|nr:Bax inhibitor-1/YccA family protein [Defluviitaleaceae bacterium]
MMRQDYNLRPTHVYDINQCDQQAVNAYVAKVFGWMFFGLLVTALTTFGIIYGINVNEAFADFIIQMQSVVFVVFIAEFALVIAISRRVERMNPTTAKFLYMVYAILNGFTFGLFAVLYSYHTGGGIQTLGMAFMITAVCFGIMAVYGLITKADLTRFGNLLWMGLIGIIIISVVNIFMRNPMMDFLICVVGLVLFLGITAHRTHMIKHHFASVALATEYEDENGYVRQSAIASNLAIVGALMLYLAFLNIFMFVLRLLGGGSRR